MLISEFEKQVERVAKKVAVQTDGKTLTYEELNKYSNAAAHQLKRNKDLLVKNRDRQIAGLLFGHGADMITGVLAALKANSIYMPLDVSYPEKRLVYMLEHSEACVILTNSEYLPLANTLADSVKGNLEIVNIDTVDTGVPHGNIQRIPAGDQLAYILYTSGSTGKPKGVIQNHRNVLYYIRNWTTRFSISETDRITLFSAFSHDAAVPDIFAALLNGATLYPRNIKEDANTTELAGWVNDNKITIWHSVPTLYRYFVHTLAEREYTGFPHLRFILLGGEQVREDDLVTFNTHFPNSIFVNIYGQTESTANSFWMVNPGEPINKILIGEPLDKTELLVINEDGGIIEDFGVGEIFTACEHFALGYWKDPENDKKVFLHDPNLGPLYRTGDLGKLISEGKIEFIGRKDSQIKIRGFRVEIGEIETALLKYETVKEAVVIANEPDSKTNYDTYLSAFFVSFQELEISELRRFLSQELPAYMIPTRFVQLEEMPLTPTNKINRKALKERDELSNEREATYVAPQNDIEEIIAGIWKEVLTVDKVGIHDNFFELGGHSLKALLLISRLEKEFNVKMPLAEIFQTPTIIGSAAYIKTEKKGYYASIEPGEEKKYYALSVAQKRLYILHQFDKSSTGYNMPFFSVLEGEIDKNIFETIFLTLIARHESLRTSFRMQEGIPVQQIHRTVDFEIGYYRTDGGANSEKTQVGEITKNFLSPFDLSRAPLLRVGLVRETEEKHILMVDMHHIISDGMSRILLMKEFMALVAGKNLPPIRLQYKDFSEWQTGKAQQEVLKEQNTYWKKQFEGEIPALDLPADYARPPIQQFDGSSATFEIGQGDLNVLQSLALKEGITLYMILLAVYYIFLSKLSGQEDILVGTPAAGRRHADLEQIIGMFVNTLVLRNSPNGDKTYKKFVEEVRKNALGAFENQDYPYEELVEELPVTRDVSRNPLFDTMFVLQNMDIPKIEIPGLKLTFYKHLIETSKFDLTLIAVEGNDKLSLTFEYSTNLFRNSTIMRFIDYFKKIVSVVIENPAVKIADIDILSEEEKKKILIDFNDTEAEYPADKTIHRLFEEQVERSGEQLAVLGKSFPAERETYTYNELNEISNRLARRLTTKGLGPGTISAILVERTPAMMVGLLGILKSGAAYLPLDPEYPAARIKYILEKSGARLLLTQGNLTRENIFSDFEGEEIDIFDETIYKAHPRSGESGNPDIDVSPASPAYVIYTSGSTGNPKGVVIRHRNAVNFIEGMAAKIDFSAGKTILALTTISFDIFFLETLMPLTRGMKVVIAGEDRQKDPALLGSLLVENRVDMIQVTPSRLRFFLNPRIGKHALASVSELLVGGEAFPPHLLEAAQETFKGYIYNVYGPTETTIWSTVKNLSTTPPGELTIGNPIANTRIYIVDREYHSQPVGVAGELMIGGDGVAAGYLNNIALTAEKFVTPPPFLTDEILYRTGDLARWLPNGEIEFLGRLDHQIKIRGFRIELEEIEEHLLKHEHIKGGVVTARKDKGRGQYVCAYFVSGQVLKISELRDYMANILPGYMVPSFFIHLDELPLTHSGKIDRRALPDPGTVDACMEYVAPKNEIEEKMIETWAEVLDIDKNILGVNDNFFERGGDSLLFLQWASKLNNAGFKVDMRDIFKNQTISQLAISIENAGYTSQTPNSSLVTGHVPLTPIQETFFTTSNIAPVHRYQAVILHFPGGFEDEACRAIFQKIQEHHDALRITFKVESENIQQINHGLEHPLSLQVFDFKNRKNALEAVEEKTKEIQSSVNPEQDSLMKLGLFHLENGDRLVIMIHPLIIDDVSWRKLLEDIHTLYYQYKKGLTFQLPPRSASFKLWAEALSEYAAGQRFLEHKKYWGPLESIPVSGIKTDFDKQGMKGGKNVIQRDSLSFDLTGEETNDLLTKVNYPFGTETTDILLTALGLSLKIVLGYNRPLIAVHGTGREGIFSHVDVGRTVGQFTHVYPVILDIPDEKDLSSAIKRTKETLHQVPNKGIGYGILKQLTAETSKPDTEFTLNPRIHFSFPEPVKTEKKETGFEIPRGSFENRVSPDGQREFEYDLDILVEKVDEHIEVTFSYSKNRFKPGTVDVLSNQFKNDLDRIISYCLAKKEKQLTPSDLTYKKLTLEELEGLSGRYRVEDIYRLTPMQEGILFHDLYEEDHSAHFLQYSYRLKGHLNVPMVQKSLNELCKRHDIMRTLFISEGFDYPLQVVLKERRVDFLYEDVFRLITGTGTDIDEFIETFREKDMKRSFDLGSDPLLRVSILQSDADEYEFIWTTHHILMDGWCVGILITEFSEIYRGYLSNTDYRLPPVNRYRTYIQWIEKRDRDESKNFWAKYLDQYSTLAAFNHSKTHETHEEGEGFELENFSIELDENTTGSLYRLAERNRVTLNTVIQAVWGILLGKYNVTRDVVFGAIVSGRPYELKGVESMVGLFINTIPVRITYNENTCFNNLLPDVQKTAIDCEQHHYFPLADIQTESQLKNDLLDHILDFANYPKLEKMSEEMESVQENKNGAGFRILKGDTFDHSNYDLSVKFLSKERLHIRFDYNGLVFEKEQIEKTTNHLTSIIEQVLDDEKILIDEISLLSEQERSSLVATLKDETIELDIEPEFDF